MPYSFKRGIKRSNSSLWCTYFPNRKSQYERREKLQVSKHTLKWQEKPSLLITLLLWLTSPIITASSGLHPRLLKASMKNVFSGFPTTDALVPVAYSRASTKGPGPRARPSSFLKYLALWIAIRGAPSRINLGKGTAKGVIWRQGNEMQQSSQSNFIPSCQDKSVDPKIAITWHRLSFLRNVSAILLHSSLLSSKEWEG